jgi:aspartyl-tRNA(Asn)/glutamyl-tRNA(Gln) amidotransferase subunit C
VELTDELIDHLADLARLEFSPGEKESIRKDLQNMIRFVDKLSGMDLEGVVPVLHMTDEENRFRDDRPENLMRQEEALSNAPMTDGNYFKVPKVIKKPNE